MVRLARLTIAVALQVAVAGGLAHAQDPAPSDVASAQAAAPTGDPVMLEDGSQLWFVEMAGTPQADGGARASILAEQDAFRASAAQAGVRFTERRAFQSLWNGLVLAVRGRDIGRLGSLATVSAVYPVVAIAPPDGEPVLEPDLLTALAMTGADVAQSELGLTGAGVKVGVIDTGVDYDHPALGGDGVARANSARFPNARIVAGWDFVGDSFTGPSATRQPDAYPDDCAGHGTHVAGIIGAAGEVTGVAPGTQIGAYRVFGCQGSTTADIMIEAMERALDDGMQVVNMSIGAERQWPQYPTAVAADRLVRKGVVVCASIGNSGVIGLWGAGAPGVGHRVIGVGSFQNEFIHLPAVTVSPEGMTVPYNLAVGAPLPALPPAEGTFPLGRIGTSSAGAQACETLAPGSMAGRVAYVRRGTCGFYAKAINAQNAGAIAVVIYNNVAGTVVPDITPVPPGAPPVTIPVVAIAQVEGDQVAARLAQGPVDISWGAVLSIPNPSGGHMSGTSSYGPTPELAIKPDLGAPGGFIRSTFPLEKGGVANLSGTSMASPHVAGAVALLLQARPHTPPGAVRDILLNSARPSRRTPGIDAVHWQGAGMLRIDDAVRSTTRIRPGKLELGEVERGAITAALSIENRATVGISYVLGRQDALTTEPYTFAASFVPDTNAVAFSPNPVYVPAGLTVSVKVTIKPDPSLPDHSLFGGYLTAIPSDGGAELSVPYLGFKGDYQTIPALTPTAADPPFPRLTRLEPAGFVPHPEGASFTLQGIDLPWIEYHLDHPVERLTWEVFDAATGKSWHRALDQRFVARNSGALMFYRTGWTGTIMRGRHVTAVPDGRYVIKVSVAKALGDDDDPADVETWTSPPITITRPAGLAQAETAVGDAPHALALAPATPNPSGGDVAFRFSLPEAGPVSLEVYDLLGRRLRAWTWSELPAGAHDIPWDGRLEGGGRAPAGLLIYRLTSKGRTLSQKLVRLP
jgi:subtilisin family serine protease